MHAMHRIPKFRKATNALCVSGSVAERPSLKYHGLDRPKGLCGAPSSPAPLMTIYAWLGIDAKVAARNDIVRLFNVDAILVVLGLVRLVLVLIGLLLFFCLLRLGRLIHSFLECLASRHIAWFLKE